MSLRRYTVSIDDRTYTIDVIETAADRFEVSVDGRVFEATIVGEQDVPGVQISPAIASAPSEIGSPAPPTGAPPSGLPIGTSPVAAPAPPPPPRARSSRAGADVLVAPMPGVILEVFVAAGTALRRGDPVLVLEAMKMRNTIRAPGEAVVTEVAVAVGQPVGTGDPLVRLGAPSA